MLKLMLLLLQSTAPENGYLAQPDESVPGNWLVIQDHVLYPDTIYDENTEPEARLIAALCNHLNTSEWDVISPFFDELFSRESEAANE